MPLCRRIRPSSLILRRSGHSYNCRTDFNPPTLVAPIMPDPTAPYSPTQTPAWQQLQKFADTGITPLRKLFASDGRRATRYQLRCGGLLLDYSKNRFDDNALNALLALAEQAPLAEQRRAMFAGEPINYTEQRAVLHTALRAHPSDGIDSTVATQVAEQLAAVERVSEQIRAGRWLGESGRAITDVVNIGIGGSDLGPKMVCTALAEFAHPTLKLHFISNVDGAEILELLKTLDPHTTLVAVASKTFTTQETLLNAHTAQAWFSRHLGLENPQSSKHFLALTANPRAAKEYGVAAEQVLEFAEWVGGRYSLWSAIGLSIALSVGFARFRELLDGARAMDQHFLSAAPASNMPILMALAGIWESNFQHSASTAVIPYCERLGLLPAYLQQLDMESNGKSCRSHGEPVDYRTGPVLWGQTGTNGQHAFFQLLHQGSQAVPVDFIAAINDNLSNAQHHPVLLGNMLAQSSALMNGQAAPDGQPYRYYPGNRPSNTLLLDELTAHNLGALIALYEHKVFVQGVIWDINSFDQWGVELGKNIANQLLRGDSPSDGSTQALLAEIAARSR